MESASLFLLASSVGVLFGWQPMPDGSDRYEYIVQIEPELAETLKEGHSIPITSDIPEDIGPIGRIRIVVGRDDLPRQKLVTNFKPYPKTPEGIQAEGIVETQYTIPSSQNSNRYNNSSQTILPPGGSTSSTNTNPFAQSLQRGANQLIDQGAQELQTKVNEILPPQSSSNLGQTIQNEARQLFGNTNQSSNNVRTADSRSILRNQNQTSSTSGGTAPTFSSNNNQTILPPGSSSSTSSTSNSSSRNSASNTLNNPISPNNVRLDQPINQNQVGNFSSNSNASLPDNPNSPRGKFDAPWPPVQINNTANNSSSNPNSRYDNQNSASNNSTWSGNSRDDSFDIANNRSNTRVADSRTEYGSNNSGPQFPTQSGNSSWPADKSSTPTIRKDMLNNPAGAPVQVVDDQNSFSGSQNSTRQDPPFQHTSARTNTDHQTNNPNWPNNQTPNTQNGPQNQPGQNNPGANGHIVNASAGGPNSIYPLILSWVLLSGSGAGNLYLFWSYLDVRSKYRGLVHGSSSRSRERYREYE